MIQVCASDSGLRLLARKSNSIIISIIIIISVSSNNILINFELLKIVRNIGKNVLDRLSKQTFFCTKPCSWSDSQTLK